jgi:hypothetical protein
LDGKIDGGIISIFFHTTDTPLMIKIKIYRAKNKIFKPRMTIWYLTRWFIGRQVHMTQTQSSFNSDIIPLIQNYQTAAGNSFPHHEGCLTAT